MLLHVHQYIILIMRLYIDGIGNYNYEYSHTVGIILKVEL